MGEAQLGKVTAIVELPWVLGTAAAVAAMAICRRSSRRANAPPDTRSVEVPGVATPRELS
jgi:hypothetical protein